MWNIGLIFFKKEKYVSHSWTSNLKGTEDILEKMNNSVYTVYNNGILLHELITNKYMIKSWWYILNNKIISLCLNNDKKINLDNARNIYRNEKYNVTESKYNLNNKYHYI